MWNKYGEFSIQMEDILEDCKLVLNVWDRDAVGTDDNLGEAVVPLKEFQDKSKQSFYKISGYFRLLCYIF